MRCLRSLFIIVFAFVLCAIGAQQALALDVENVRFGQHNGKTRLVLDISDITDFRAFTLENPYRMVVDLPRFNWKAGTIERPAHAQISDIRQGGLAPNVSRIVFDLGRPAVIQSAFLLPKNGDKQNRIVIDYGLTTAAQFQAQKGTIHGTLQIEEVEDQDQRKAVSYVATQAGGIPLPPPNAMRPVKQKYLQNASRNKPLIVIDPGHGGVDPGAIGAGKIHEKTVVLALGKELRDQLNRTGKYRAILTRDKDVFIKLKDRVKFARERGADLFVSIHADSIHKASVSGTSVYTLSKKSSDAQTAKLAEKENRADLIGQVDVDIEDEQVAFILGDFLMNDTMNQSKFFANKLVGRLKAHGIKTLQNPHRYAGFAVLKAPDIPSILIEAGFMSNKAEARLLNQSAHRRKLAGAILSGIDSYFDYVHENERN